MGTLRGCGAMTPYVNRKTGQLMAQCPTCSVGELARAPWVLGTWEQVQERALVRALDRDSRLTPDEALVAVLVRRALSIPPCGKAGPMDPALIRRVQLEVQEQVEQVAPLVPAREAVDEEVPRAARTLVKLCQERGWRVLVHYALGTTPASSRSTGRLIHSVCVRARLEGRGLVAVWVVSGDQPVPEAGWKFDVAYVWDWPERPAHKVGATALKPFIQEG